MISTKSAARANALHIYHSQFIIRHSSLPPQRHFLVGEGGFEPPKSLTTDLQSAPFGHSGIPPYLFWSWWRESNPQPAHYKCAALPMSYTSVWPLILLPSSAPRCFLFFALLLIYILSIPYFSVALLSKGANDMIANESRFVNLNIKYKCKILRW